MKHQLALLFFLSMTYLSSFAQKPDWDAVIDRYYEKYQVQETPDWIFPLVFKNGWDERDTIYYIWEEGTSKFELDTIFGEYYIPIDTSVFNMFWEKCSSSICDSLMVTKVKVLEFNNTISESLRKIKAKLPMTIYFNAQFLHDVPFVPDQDDTPDAQGGIRTDFDVTTIEPWDVCGWGFAATITDTVIHQNIQCHFADSVVLHGINPSVEFITSAFFDFSLGKWYGQSFNVSIKDQQVEKESIQIFPNPSSGLFQIKIPSVVKSGKIKVFNLLGQRLFEKMLTENQQTIDISFFPDGIYLLILESQGQIQTTKIIKESFK